MLTLANNVRTAPAYDVPTPLGGGWLLSLPASFGTANFSNPSAIVSPSSALPTPGAQ